MSPPLWTLHLGHIHFFPSSHHLNFRAIYLPQGTSDHLYDKEAKSGFHTDSPPNSFMGSSKPSLRDLLQNFHNIHDPRSLLFLLAAQGPKIEQSLPRVFSCPWFLLEKPRTKPPSPPPPCPVLVQASAPTFSCYVTSADLELTMSTRLVSSSQRPDCLCLPRPGSEAHATTSQPTTVSDVDHHTGPRPAIGSCLTVVILRTEGGRATAPESKFTAQCASDSLPPLGQSQDKFTCM